MIIPPLNPRYKFLFTEYVLAFSINGVVSKGKSRKKHFLFSIKNLTFPCSVAYVNPQVNKLSTVSFKLWITLISLYGLIVLYDTLP